MKEYLISITSIILFISILELFIPNNKIGAFVKGIVGVVSIILMLSPIISIFNKNYDYEFTKNDYEYTNYLVDYEKKIIKEEIDLLLKTNDLTPITIEIIGEVLEGDFKIYKIYIKIENKVISNENEHINKLENAKKLILERLFLDSPEIEIEYENPKTA